ncbi:response regulator [Rubellimicrobium roseum]|uniref:Response regulator n=1 Tax=Rubellimicrobium roseum TaxID=687525 RepID=A0A5C4N616_9RHOB|nr:response regulator [Rubellimicrobium roseum]TNC65391.1 response regulator [Rubellimicrobium roseum]
MLHSTPSSLRGRRILVVEDDFVVADDFRCALEQDGAEVVGPVSNVAQALALLPGAPPLDAAILDINLGGLMVYPVADVLRQHGIPFVFVSGYDHEEVPDSYADVPYCEKPLDVRRCVRELLT